MELQDKVSLIRCVSLFKGLNEGDLQKLSEIASQEKLALRGVVFTEGSTGDALYVISYGTVRVLKNGPEGQEEVSRMGNGQSFGEMALIDDERRSATIEAVEHVELLRIKREDLESLVAADDGLAHRVYRAFSKHLSQRLRQTTDDLAFMRERARRRSS